jgi:hypothetical protein
LAALALRCGVRDQGGIWFVRKPNLNGLHPAMKSVELLERAVRNSSTKRDTVLDPFGGSATQRSRRWRRPCDCVIAVNWRTFCNCSSRVVRQTSANNYWSRTPGIKLAGCSENADADFAALVRAFTASTEPRMSKSGPLRTERVGHSLTFVALCWGVWRSNPFSSLGVNGLPVMERSGELL